MHEIGGYLELEKSKSVYMHRGALEFNLARNALAYLIIEKNIRDLYVPFFLCSAIFDICHMHNVKVHCYHTDETLTPMLDGYESGWIYIVNYYGQLSNEEIKKYKDKYNYIIVDNVQAYFQEPVKGVDTVYTCRKFFGVPDGAFLYSDVQLDEDIIADVSYDKMLHILGRFEADAQTFYDTYSECEKNMSAYSIKKMSKLTQNLLGFFDYDIIKEKRTKNYNFIHREVGRYNKLNLKNIEGAYAYPLYIDNGCMLREVLMRKKVYIPTLWPNVLNMDKSFLEYDMAKNILPIPVDQRYSENDMKYIIELLDCFLREI